MRSNDDSAIDLGRVFLATQWNNGEVLGNYDRANKMLRQLYGKHVGLHGYA